jgi:uncharacterized membrane-anchored protein YitT (DUF2179 family)
LIEKHSQKEDAIAILTGTFLFAQGIFFLHSAHLITGGTAGVALLLSQLLPFSFGMLYFMVNAPFYIMAWRRFGFRFAIYSAISGILVSIMADYLPTLITLDAINDGYSAIGGGLLMGIGMLILFRHRSSLGGFNVLCLYVQDKVGISIGKTQIVLDCLIIATSFFFVPLPSVLFSILSAAMLNIVLGMNHKPTRYTVTYH